MKQSHFTVEPCLICTPLDDLPNEMAEFMRSIRQLPQVYYWFSRGKPCFNCHGTGEIRVQEIRAGR